MFLHLLGVYDLIFTCPEVFPECYSCGDALLKATKHCQLSLHKYTNCLLCTSC